MAREESAREDLLREATALVERIELDTSPSDVVPERIVAGFRTDGSLSFFFGEDPVYQFNTAGELRRAYCNGLMFKAIRGQLAALERRPTEYEVQLVCHELTETEQSQFLARMADHLSKLEAILAKNAFTIVGQVPPGTHVTQRVRDWLANHPHPPIASRPNTSHT